MRRVLLAEWEWRRRRDEWKRMKENDINVGPSRAPSPEVLETVEVEEETKPEAAVDENLAKSKSGESENQDDEKGVQKDKSDGNKTKRTLQDFLDRVALADLGNARHPRKSELGSPQETKTTFFMPLEFSGDIRFQAFSHDPVLPSQKVEPLVPSTAVSRRMAARKAVSRSTTMRSPEPSMDAHDNEAGGYQSSEASAEPAPPPEYLFHENAKLITGEDFAIQPSSTDFSYITNSVKNWKKRIAKERTNQLYRTSNRDVPPEEWTALVVKTAVNWPRYFQQDRESAIASSAGAKSPEERRRLQEEAFLQELRNGNVTADTIQGLDSMHSLDDLQVPSVHPIAYSTKFTETTQTIGALASKMIAVESVGGIGIADSQSGSMRVKENALDGYQDLRGVIPESLIQELHELDVARGLVKKNEGIKPLPFGHVEKISLKAGVYKYYQVGLRIFSASDSRRGIRWRF